MTSLTRTFVSVGAGIVSGRVGLILGAIFLPLAFPLSLESSQPEDTAITLMILITLLFATGGFILCWRLTAGKS